MDVASGYFNTVVVTEQGSAFMVGHCKYRSYYTHIEGLSSRTPAWNLDLPGRAVKCWAHKNNSLAYVSVEDDAGVQTMYSGVDFVDQYE